MNMNRRKFNRRKFIKDGWKWSGLLFVPTLIRAQSVIPARRGRYTGAGGGGGGGGGTVAFDNVTTSFDLTTASNTKAHTMSATANNILIVFIVEYSATAPAITTVPTYAGANLTLIQRSQMTDGAQGFITAYYKVGCATGSNNIVCTLDATLTDWDWAAMSFTGVLQSGTIIDGTQFANAGAAALATVTVTTGSANDMCVDCTCSTTNNGTTSGAGQTQKWLNNSGNVNTMGSYKAGAASVTMTENYDGSNSGKAIMAFNIHHA